MAKRIDFTMFGKQEKESAGSMIIPEELQHVMSDSKMLADTMKHLAKGVCVFWVSDGDWSMHQMLMAILEVTGPADVYMSTYAMNETAARIIAQLKDDKIISHLYCLLDDRIDVRAAGSLQLIKATANKCTLLHTHAKVTAVRNFDWKVAVIGSANYTENKRYEAGVMICDDKITDQQIAWIEKALHDADQ